MLAKDSKTAVFCENFDFWFKILRVMLEYDSSKRYTNLDTILKGIYNTFIEDFIQVCLPYYHISKRKYLERKLTYNSFVTIIRQICNFNNITYTSQIKYNKSTYDIVYYIYF